MHKNFQSKVLQSSWNGAICEADGTKETRMFIMCNFYLLLLYRDMFYNVYILFCT